MSQVGESEKGSDDMKEEEEAEGDEEDPCQCVETDIRGAFDREMGVSVEEMAWFAEVQSEGHSGSRVGSGDGGSGGAAADRTELLPFPDDQEGGGQQQDGVDGEEWMENDQSSEGHGEAGYAARENEDADVDEGVRFSWHQGQAWSAIKAADSLMEQRSVVRINPGTVSAVPQWAVLGGGLLDLPDGGGGEVEFALEELQTGQWKQGLYVDALVLEQVL